MTYTERRRPGVQHRGDVDDPSRAGEVSSEGNRVTRLPEPFVNTVFDNRDAAGLCARRAGREGTA
jgi:hypothetical protein